MEIYNICSGLNNIYLNLNNKCSDELCSNDVLEMFDPFFNNENDYYDVEYEISNQIGGGVLGMAVKSLGSSKVGKGVGSIGNKLGAIGSNISNIAKKTKDKTNFALEQPGKAWDFLREMGGVNDPNDPIEGMKGMDATARSKKFIRQVVFIGSVLILIGGMPILPWAIIIYFTFKKLRSGYRHLIQPI
jgi:hypothetical protein